MDNDGQSDDFTDLDGDGVVDGETGENEIEIINDGIPSFHNKVDTSELRAML